MQSNQLPYETSTAFEHRDGDGDRYGSVGFRRVADVPGSERVRSLGNSQATGRIRSREKRGLEGRGAVVTVLAVRVEGSPFSDHAERRPVGNTLLFHFERKPGLDEGGTLGTA